ncbi:MAG: DUF3302 domain-containing protein [Pirellulaceae bacterium]|nr:DUF3302 domain-containing protein [Pirellulaceae bacterium]
MTALDVFAVIILIVILLAFISALIILGMPPGKIARDRNHPQADAITVCGWWGVITVGILLPLAFIWASTKCETTEKLEESRKEA